MKFKKCFKCNKTYPLFMYQKSDTPPIKSAMGKAYVCRICNFTESKGRVCRKQPNGSFKVVQLSLKERIKEFIGE